MEEDLLVLKFDGACDNNSKFKWMGIGVAVWVNGERAEQYDSYDMVGPSGTNNIAEWEALNRALEIALSYVSTSTVPVKVRIYGDSQIVVRQFTRVYEVKKPHLIPYFEESQQLKKAIGDSLRRVDWIPREKNTEADELSKKGVVEYLKNM